MAFIDKPDLKTGFWVGLGLLGAFLVLGLLQAAYYRARGRASGG
jgi:hypothetical protein